MHIICTLLVPLYNIAKIEIQYIYPNILEISKSDPWSLHPYSQHRSNQSSQNSPMSSITLSPEQITNIQSLFNTALHAALTTPQAKPSVPKPSRASPPKKSPTGQAAYSAYMNLMRKTNERLNELILEFLHADMLIKANGTPFDTPGAPAYNSTFKLLNKDLQTEWKTFSLHGFPEDARPASLQSVDQGISLMDRSFDDLIKLAEEKGPEAEWLPSESDDDYDDDREFDACVYRTPCAKTIDSDSDSDSD